MSDLTCSILLVAADARFLELMATELRLMGCRVACAQDMAEAAELVRTGALQRYVLVRLGEEDAVAARVHAGRLAN